MVALPFVLSAATENPMFQYEKSDFDVAALSKAAHAIQSLSRLSTWLRDENRS
jgi:hypothetical protein